MKSLRGMSYKDYGISKERYLELKHFCLQYEEKKKNARPGKQAEQKENSIRDCKLIEQAAKQTDEMLSPYILKCVATGLPYEYLGNVPVSRNDFYGYRRLFFHHLDKER